MPFATDILEAKTVDYIHELNKYHKQEQTRVYRHRRSIFLFVRDFF